MIWNASRPVAPRFPWQRDEDPLIQELDDERALLLSELSIEPDPILRGLRRDLVFALEGEIATLRTVGNASAGELG